MGGGKVSGVVSLGLGDGVMSMGQPASREMRG